jgi:Protein of unknown function (DUF2613)
MPWATTLIGAEGGFYALVVQPGPLAALAGTQNIVCYVGRMDRFLVPAGASIVVGLLLGAAAIFGVTLMVQQDSKPLVQPGDPASSVLNRVEYGDRT